MPFRTLQDTLTRNPMAAIKRQRLPSPEESAVFDGAFSFGSYLQTNQMKRYPTVPAVRVKGTPIFMKSPKEVECPSFFRMPTAVMLALAPIGVMLPPRVAPESRPN